MTSSGAAPLPERPVDPAWLALREPADARARDRGCDLVIPPLLSVLGDGRDAAIHVVDVGAGTGANLRWLAPRLGPPARQRWTLVDHDPELVAWGTVRTDVVRADVAELPSLLPGMGAADLVTASALLDVLDHRRLTALVEAVVSARAPGLFSLSVTGEVTLDPPDLCDDLVALAFEAHQRRGRLLGAEAGAALVAMFDERGWSVVQTATPWLLDAREDAGVIAAWLDGRAEAAAEQRPDLAAPVEGWLVRRRAQLEAGRLTAVVGHADVLALPPTSVVRTPPDADPDEP